MTCPKSLGPSLHAQPEPWDSVVNLGISSTGRHLLPWTLSPYITPNGRALASSFCKPSAPRADTHRNKCAPTLADLQFAIHILIV
jgi:hypothetical protein